MLGLGVAVSRRGLRNGGVVFPVAAVISSSPFRSALDSSVLMLNAHYMALRVVSARRAFSLLFKCNDDDLPIAEVVDVEDGRYVSYTFADWAEVSRFRREFEPARHDWVRTVRLDIAVPRIIRVLSYSKVPRQEVKFNRRNIYARDRNRCQYCGRKFSTTELSLDHVVPRSRAAGPPGRTWSVAVSSATSARGPDPGGGGHAAYHPPGQTRAQPGDQHQALRDQVSFLAALPRPGLLERRTAVAPLLAR